MVIVVNRGLLLPDRSTDKITAAIPNSKKLNDNDVLVKWGVDESRVLRNLNIKEVPSPILGKYEWTGRYTPFDHQKTGRPTPTMDTAWTVSGLLHNRCHRPGR